MYATAVLLRMSRVLQVIEELMSIADGQVVLQRDSATGAVGVNPQASISRIGSRAYPPALAELAIDLRFELAQVSHPLLIFLGEAVRHNSAGYQDIKLT